MPWHPLGARLVEQAKLKSPTARRLVKLGNLLAGIGLLRFKTQHDLPIAPNFFLAAKGPDGSAAVAKRQACYDGALGERGMHSLQSY
jgi:hypothetical protein